MALARRRDEWDRVTTLVQWQGLHLVGKAPDASGINPYRAADRPVKSAATLAREQRHAERMLDEYMTGVARGNRR